MRAHAQRCPPVRISAGQWHVTQNGQPKILFPSSFHLIFSMEILPAARACCNAFSKTVLRRCPARPPPSCPYREGGECPFSARHLPSHLQKCLPVFRAKCNRQSRRRAGGVAGSKSRYGGSRWWGWDRQPALHMSTGRSRTPPKNPQNKPTCPCPKPNRAHGRRKGCYAHGGRKAGSSGVQGVVVPAVQEGWQVACGQGNRRRQEAGGSPRCVGRKAKRQGQEATGVCSVVVVGRQV